MMEPKPTYTTGTLFDAPEPTEPIIERSNGYGSNRYLLFEPADSVTYIHTRFMARYGAYPLTIKTTGGGQLAGPLPEGK
jgi:hypothetical protein